jgi:hypothetical protein
MKKLELISTLLDQKADEKINTLSSDLPDAVQAWVEKCCEEMGIKYDFIKYRDQFECENIRSVESTIVDKMKEALMELMVEQFLETLQE